METMTIDEARALAARLTAAADAAEQAGETTIEGGLIALLDTSVSAGLDALERAIETKGD